MGLVVLSVFALTLAFAACADTGGEDPNQGGQGGQGGTPGSTVGTGKVPLTLAIEKYPDPLLDLNGNPTGVVHEGQPVELKGIKAKLYYSDDSWQEITDVTKFTVNPSIYNWYYRNGNYTVTYTQDGIPFSATIPGSALGTHRRIVDISATGRLSKQKWYIDEVPKLDGVVLNAWYSLNNDVPNYAPGQNTEYDWYNLYLPFDPLNPDYKWAWVWNTSRNYVNDQPGLLLEVGAYGDIAGSYVEPGNVPNDSIGHWGELIGRRLPIEQLVQVKSLKWDPEPTFPDIFYDNPLLIDAYVTADYVKGDWGLGSWRDILNTGKISLEYEDGEGPPNNRPYTLTELETRNANRYWGSYRGYDQNSNFQGGTWAEGIQMGLFNLKGTTGYAQQVLTDASLSMGDTYIWGATSASYTYGGGWAQWAALAQPQIRIAYRGRTTPLLEVPIYNRPSSMAITIRGDSGPPVIVSGYNYVYKRAETMNDFLQKVVVAVTYERRGNTSATAVREDIYNDIYILKNCRDTYTSTNGFTAPTLFSSNVYNAVGFPADSNSPPGSDILLMANIDAAYDVSYSGSGGSILTATNSQKAKDNLMGRIYYFGWAGDPDNRRSVNARINVLPEGWTFDYQ